MSWAHGHWQKGIPFTYCRVMGTTFYKQISVLLKTPGMKGKDHNAAFCSSGHPFSDTFLESDSIWCSLPLTKLPHSLQGSHSSDHIPITLVTLAFCCCCCYFCPSSQNVNSLQQPTMSILHHFQPRSPSDVPNSGISTSSQSTKPHFRYYKGEENCLETSFRTFSELT